MVYAAFERRCTAVSINGHANGYAQRDCLLETCEWVSNRSGESAGESR